MKRVTFNVLILVLLSAAIFSTSAIAQQHKHHEKPTKEEIKKKTEEVADELKLTGDKRSQFIDVHVKHFEKKKASHKKGQKPSREEKEASRKELQEQVKAILNDSEYEQYKTIMKQKREERRKKCEANPDCKKKMDKRKNESK